MSGSQATDAVKVLVTGASGYIATHVVQQLQRLGYQVRGTVRSTRNEIKIQPLKNLCPDAKYPLELVEADLTSESGWVEAVTGCTYVMHTASPVFLETPKDENEFITPAVNGTLNVLKACVKVGGVKRVVLTSSCASIVGYGDHVDGKNFTEDDWSDVDKIPAYYKSKTLAEKAAWDFIEKLPEKEKFALAVINPCLVMGPALCGTIGASMKIMRNLLLGESPPIQKWRVGLVDVRDVARAHVVAMTKPEAAANRHILATEVTTMGKMTQILLKEFGSQGYNITEVVPSDDPDKRYYYNNSRMKTKLGIDPISVEKSLVDMAYSMIESGIVDKTDQYKGQH